MPLITWTDDLSVGIKSIDNQHKNLINIINTLNDSLINGSTDEVLNEIFDGLAAYTLTHFSYEERLFTKHGYAGTDEHEAEHAALKKQVLNLQREMHDGNFMIGLELMTFLKQWLTHHIQETDKDYSEFLISHGVK